MIRQNVSCFSVISCLFSLFLFATGFTLSSPVLCAAYVRLSACDGLKSAHPAQVCPLIAWTTEVYKYHQVVIFPISHTCKRSTASNMRFSLLLFTLCPAVLGSTLEIMDVGGLCYIYSNSTRGCTGSLEAIALLEGTSCSSEYSTVTSCGSVLAEFH